MICPNCGREVPEGAQCPCTTGAPAPMLSSNPALHVIKTIGSSGVFLTMAILWSCAAVLRVFSSLEIDNSLSAFYSFGWNMGMDMESLMNLMSTVRLSAVLNAIFSSIPLILITAGVWMVYATCKNRNSGNVSTAGLTLCKVLSIISLVGVCLLAVVLLLAMAILVFAGGVAMLDGFGGMGGDETVFLFFVGLVSIILLLGVGFNIFYQVCVIKTINRIKKTALTGVADSRVSSFLIVVNYIAAFFTAFGGLFSFFGFAPISGLHALATAGAAVLVSVCLSKYRKQMTMVMYPPVQPVYAAPAQYVAPQAEPEASSAPEEAPAAQEEKPE